MAAAARWCAVAAAAACAPSALAALPVGSELPEAPLARSSEGALHASLTLGVVELAGSGWSLRTRAFNGSVPGPTLAVYPGDELSIRFHNSLGSPRGHSATNNYHHPNTTNLHVHGLHVNPNAPGDDVLGVSLGPGESFHYKYRLPDDHSPGTYWVHPHHDGSQVQQTGAGAAGALLVLDPPGFLSEQLAALEDRALVLQDFNGPLLDKAAAASGDHVLRAPEKWWGPERGADLVLVNGAQRPAVSAPPGTWQRLRLIMAGPSAWLNLVFGQCEVALMAKDGIYIADFPRPVKRVLLPPGGRADLAVRCPGGPDAGEALHRVVSEPQLGDAGVKVLAGHVFSIRAVGQRTPGLASEALMAWSPPWRPAYLQDLRSQETADCSCVTAMGLGGNTRAFNGHTFGGPADFMHHSPRGAVVERLLVGVDKHTYHQHTWPFQLQDTPAGGDGWFRAGDWHDSYLNTQQDRVLVRWRAVDYDGPVVVHCHALAHSDQGMIAVELVGGSGRDQCGCDLLNQPKAAEALLGGDQGGTLVLGAAAVCCAIAALASAAAVTFVRGLARAREDASAYNQLSGQPTPA